MCDDLVQYGAETFEILDELEQVSNYLGISHNIKSTSQSEAALNDVLSALPRILGTVPRNNWRKPPGEYRGDKNSCPQRVVAEKELVQRLMDQGYHQTTVTMAIFRAVESGRLGCGIQRKEVLTRGPNERRTLLRKDPKDPARNAEKIIRYSPEEYDLHVPWAVHFENTAWIWPTALTLKKHRGLRTLYEGDRQRKKRGPRQIYDPIADEQIFRAWGQRPRKWKTYEELGNALGKTRKEIAHAIDRHRARAKRKKQ